MKKNNILQEVCLLRLLLIFLLVSYHAFAPFCGAWKPLEGMEETPNSVYAWIGYVFYSFMLESFTFISGYVFGFQVQRKGQSCITFHNLAVKKFQRLIIPSIVFSIIYMLIFNPDTFIHTPIHALYNGIQGVAHMWYLPMLFWCFIGIWMIEKLNFSRGKSICLLLVLAVVSFVPLPFQLTFTMYYMVFFFTGYVVKKSNFNLTNYSKTKNIIILWILFIISFIFLQNGILYLKVILRTVDQIPLKLTIQCLIKLSRLVYSSLGVIAVIFTSLNLIRYHSLKLSDKAITLSTYCFGIYLFQQFILQLIYYKTDWNSMISVYALPWLAIIITIILSWLLSHLALRTRIGRLLIG